MFQAGMPENIIQDCSGHISTDGLCKYEKISEEQQVSAFKVMSGNGTGETFA